MCLAASPFLQFQERKPHWQSRTLTRRGFRAIISIRKELAIVLYCHGKRVQSFTFTVAAGASYDKLRREFETYTAVFGGRIRIFPGKRPSVGGREPRSRNTDTAENPMPATEVGDSKGGNETMEIGSIPAGWEWTRAARAFAQILVDVPGTGKVKPEHASRCRTSHVGPKVQRERGASFVTVVYFDHGAETCFRFKVRPDGRTAPEELEKRIIAALEKEGLRSPAAQGVPDGARPLPVGWVWTPSAEAFVTRLRLIGGVEAVTPRRMLKLRDDEPIADPIFSPHRNNITAAYCEGERRYIFSVEIAGKGVAVVLREIHAAFRKTRRGGEYAKVLGEQPAPPDTARDDPPADPAEDTEDAQPVDLRLEDGIPLDTDPHDTPHTDGQEDTATMAKKGSGAIVLRPGAVETYEHLLTLAPSKTADKWDVPAISGKEALGAIMAPSQVTTRLKPLQAAGLVSKGRRNPEGGVSKVYTIFRKPYEVSGNGGDPGDGKKSAHKAAKRATRTQAANTPRAHADALWQDVQALREMGLEVELAENGTVTISGMEERIARMQEHVTALQEAGLDVSIDEDGIHAELHTND